MRGTFYKFTTDFNCYENYYANDFYKAIDFLGDKLTGARSRIKEMLENGDNHIGYFFVNQLETTDNVDVYDKDCAYMIVDVAGDGGTDYFGDIYNAIEFAKDYYNIDVNELDFRKETQKDRPVSSEDNKNTIICYKVEFWGGENEE